MLVYIDSGSDDDSSTTNDDSDESGTVMRISAFGFVSWLQTSSSALAERPRELGDFKRAGHFEAKF